jgi:hypothetical protein
MHQVTIFATITTSTPQTVAAIINHADDGPARADAASQTADDRPRLAGRETPALYPLPRPAAGHTEVQPRARRPGPGAGRPRAGVV